MGGGEERVEGPRVDRVPRLLHGWGEDGDGEGKMKAPVTCPARSTTRTSIGKRRGLLAPFRGSDGDCGGGGSGSMAACAVCGVGA